MNPWLLPFLKSLRPSKHTCYPIRPLGEDNTQASHALALKRRGPPTTDNRSVSVMLLVCGLLFAAGCVSTNTDPNTVSPTARLEIFGTGMKPSFVKVDITEDDTRHPSPPAVQEISNELLDNSLIIRATGSQLERGLGKLRLEVTASLNCTKLTPGPVVGSYFPNAGRQAAVPPRGRETNGYSDAYV
jgi:hypothetical protein